MASTKQKTIELNPSSTQSQIHRLEYVYGEDTIYVEAVVEDIQQIRSQTYLEPAEYGSALCFTHILWGDDISEHNEPSIEEIDQAVFGLDDSSWKIINEEPYNV